VGVELSGPGEVHGRSTVNVNRARARVTSPQIVDAEQRAAEMRANWKARADAAKNASVSPVN